MNEHKRPSAEIRNLYADSVYYTLVFSYSLIDNVIYMLFTHWEFFTSVLADGLLLEFEWEQVSSSLLDFSQYSGRSQWCCRLDSLHSSANFQILQAL